MTATNEQLVRESPASADELIREMSNDYRFHPLYGVAMLKVSFELRPGKKPGFEQILKNTLSGLQAGERELEDYVKMHRAGLERRCKELGI